MYTEIKKNNNSTSQNKKSKSKNVRFIVNDIEIQHKPTVIKTVS